MFLKTDVDVKHIDFQNNKNFELTENFNNIEYLVLSLLFAIGLLLISKDLFSSKNNDNVNELVLDYVENNICNHAFYESIMKIVNPDKTKATGPLVKTANDKKIQDNHQTSPCGLAIRLQ